MLRITPQTHAAAASAADALGKSLNQWSEDVLAEAARRVVGG
jgi:predicted HicB family RNase H-like nuclease